MRFLDIYDLPVIDSPSSGDNTPGNIQQPTIEFSPELTIVFIVAATILTIVLIALIVGIITKSKRIQNLEQFTAKNISEEEQNLINNFRKLNPQGQAIIKDTCKTLTDNQKTNKNDGV